MRPSPPPTGEQEATHRRRKEEWCWGAASHPDPGKALERVLNGSGTRGALFTQNAESANSGDLWSKQEAGRAHIQAGTQCTGGHGSEKGSASSLSHVSSKPLPSLLLLFLPENSILFCFKTSS